MIGCGLDEYTWWEVVLWTIAVLTTYDVTKWLTGCALKRWGRKTP